MSDRVLRVTLSPAEQREKLASLRKDMNGVELPPAGTATPEAETLDALVERELKAWLKASASDPKARGFALTAAIKYLAVKQKVPIPYGSELDLPEGAE